MRLKRLNSEVERMSLVSYHRAFVAPGATAKSDYSAEVVHHADIYFQDKIPMGQGVEELDKLDLPEDCSAQMVNEHGQIVSFTMCGTHRSVDYLGQNYRNLDELAERLDMPFHWTEVKSIRLCFSQNRGMNPRQRKVPA